MRLLVCGGRYYANKKRVAEELEKWIRPGDLQSIVIHGGAAGADTLAAVWCQQNGVHAARVDALWDWTRPVKAAGPRRNTVMLLLEPELVLAFPGGGGTADMVIQAERAGLDVRRIEREV